VTSPRRGSRRDAEGPGIPGTGGATLRGALLVGVAVVIGVVLLGKGFDTGFLPSSSDTPSERANDDDDGDATTTSTSTTVTPTTHTADQVRVIVLNGGGPSGSASTSGTALAAAGFVSLDAADTDDVAATIVYFAPTFDADAAVVAGTLGLTNPPQPLPATAITGAPAAGEVDVIVILGPDFTPVG
jgi:hypothetical protein